MENELNEFLRAFTKVLQRHTVMVARKAGIDVNSELANSFEVRLRPDFKGIQFIANDYLENVDKGRAPRTRRVPVDELLNWINEKGIRSPGMTTNELAFAIQKSIYEQGIQPTPVMDQLQRTILDMLEKEMGKELEAITADEIVKHFKI